jgi:hypothetical protein
MTQPAFPARLTRLAAAFAACLMLAVAPAAADPYTVRQIAVDVAGATSVEAQQRAYGEARVEGANRLIRRLTLAEDRQTAGVLNIDSATAQSLASGVDTDADSKRTATRFIGVLAVKFNAAAVRQYLDARGVPFVDTQAGRALIVPVAQRGAVDGAAWAAAWAGRRDDDALTPWVASAEYWDALPAWADVQAEAAGAEALRAVLAEAYVEAGQTYVRMVEVGPGGAQATLAVTGPHADLAAAAAAALAEMETAWKRESIVRTSGSTPISLVASFTALDQWVRIQRALETSRIVSGLDIEAVSAVGADLSFLYAGRPDQLAADLRARGVTLTASERGWVLTAAAAQ